MSWGRRRSRLSVARPALAQRAWRPTIGGDDGFSGTLLVSVERTVRQFRNTVCRFPDTAILRTSSAWPVCKRLFASHPPPAQAGASRCRCKVVSAGCSIRPNAGRHGGDAVSLLAPPQEQGRSHPQLAGQQMVSSSPVTSFPTLQTFISKLSLSSATQAAI